MPKCSISIGIVANPTMVNVVMNAAIGVKNEDIIVAVEKLENILMDNTK